MKKIVTVAMLISGLALTSAVFAEDKTIAQVQNILKTVMPKGMPDSVAESTIPGLYEAVYGAQVIYITADGRYMVEGDIYDIQKRVNITESKRQGGRVKAVRSLEEDTLISFKPEGETKYVITAFTDIDCGYCRKLHREMADYNKLGIEIRYAAYPRSGVNTKSYYKAEKVWCAKDRQKAMSFAKNGAKLKQLQALEQVKEANCGQAIKKHMSVAREVGVTGTPTLVMDNGEVLPGYVPADRLISILKKQKKS